MQNVRHLWISVRPNGDRRPYNLNRLELRICDLMVDPIALLAVTALLEARLWQLIADPGLDPLERSSLPAQTRSEDLLAMTMDNEAAAARNSLDAQLRHWEDGRLISAREWIEQLYDEAYLTAKKRGFSCFLSPVRKILREGNTAQQWISQYNKGSTIREILSQGIQNMVQQERDLEEKLCQLLVA
jgi:predicted glutamate--cysteine ligase